LIAKKGLSKTNFSTGFVAAKYNAKGQPVENPTIETLAYFKLSF
jgi:hypothetical protein